MSEAMPLYTLCKEDLESMDKEVRPRRARPVPSQPHRRGTLPEAGTGPDSRKGVGSSVQGCLRVSIGMSTLTRPERPLVGLPPPSAPHQGPDSVWGCR